MITALTSISVILVVVIVLVVAYHLIGVYFALKRGADHLEALAAGLAKVRNDTKPLNQRVDNIIDGLSSLAAPLLNANNNLAAIVDVVGRKSG
jgi:hypothetical protein